MLTESISSFLKNAILTQVGRANLRFYFVFPIYSVSEDLVGSKNKQTKRCINYAEQPIRKLRNTYCSMKHEKNSPWFHLCVLQPATANPKSLCMRSNLTKFILINHSHKN